MCQYKGPSQAFLFLLESSAMKLQLAKLHYVPIEMK